MSYEIDKENKVVYINPKTASKKEMDKANELVEKGYKLIHGDQAEQGAGPMPHNMGINISNNRLF